jgi:hypothetical protein
MSILLKKIRGYLMVALAAVASGGCLFPGSVSVFSSDGFVSISIGDVEWNACEETQGGGTYECDFFTPDGVSIVNLTLPQLLFRLVLLDPLVVQLPAGVSNFAGSFLNNDTGIGGPLVIMPGLTSVRVDLDRTLTAEPGTQLVVIALPDAATVPGNFSFNLNFSVPPGTTSLTVKPIVTGLVELTDGSVFYPPLYPCAQSMASAPALTLPIPVPGDAFTLPPGDPALACSGEVYNYVAGGPGPGPGSAATDIPLLTPWMLLVLAGLLGGAGAMHLRGRRRR